MPLKAVAWLALFLFFMWMTFRRSSWGAALYMMTYYASPTGWWWGKGFLSSITSRWSLVAALIFAAGVLLDTRPRPSSAPDHARPVFLLLLIYVLNATLVHLLFADNPELSRTGLETLWKQLVLSYLLVAAIRTDSDLKVLMWAVLLGGAYVGYEVIFGGAGSREGGRLAGVAALGEAGGGNALAGLLAFSLPLGGYFFFFGRKLSKLPVIFSLVFVFEVVLRCVSRGCFLGMIAGGAWLLLRSRGRQRIYPITGIALALLAAVVLWGENLPQKILGRFETTFAPAEERDDSALSRIEFWRRGLAMVRDHPLGSGFAAAFRSDLGLSYITGLGETRYRSVHNGYIDIAAGWGVQGLALYLGAILLAFWALWRSTSRAYAAASTEAGFLGICLEAALVIQLVATMFGSTLDGESFFWWIAMALAFARILPESASGEPREGGASEVTDKGPQTG